MGYLCFIPLSLAVPIPPQGRKLLRPRSPVELGLVLSLTLGIYTVKCHRMSAETSPADPSPLGVEVTVDTSPAGASSTQNRFAAA